MREAGRTDKTPRASRAKERRAEGAEGPRLRAAVGRRAKTLMEMGRGTSDEAARSPQGRFCTVRSARRRFGALDRSVL